MESWGSYVAMWATKFSGRAYPYGPAGHSSRGLSGWLYSLSVGFLVDGLCSWHLQFPGLFVIPLVSLLLLGTYTTLSWAPGRDCAHTIHLGLASNAFFWNLNGSLCDLITCILYAWKTSSRLTISELATSLRLPGLCLQWSVSTWMDKHGKAFPLVAQNEQVPEGFLFRWKVYAFDLCVGDEWGLASSWDPFKPSFQCTVLGLSQPHSLLLQLYFWPSFTSCSSIFCSWFSL